jgi:hypothetical protein
MPDNIADDERSWTHQEDSPRQIVLYGTCGLYKLIQEEAARESMTASTWMRRVIIAALPAKTNRQPAEPAA